MRRGLANGVTHGAVHARKIQFVKDRAGVVLQALEWRKFGAVKVVIWRGIRDVTAGKCSEEDGNGRDDVCHCQEGQQTLNCTLQD